MIEEKDRFKHKLDFLFKAIDDAQNTIRFADTKAGAVIAFWSLVITALIRTKESWYSWLISINTWIDKIVVYIILILMIYFCVQSVWLAYLTIVPKSNPDAHIDKDGVDVQGLFYLHAMKPTLKGKYLYHNYSDLKLAITTKEYLCKLDGLSDADIHKELAFELQKVSFIRNLKIHRVNIAITAVIRFLITLFILFVYWFGHQFIQFKGDNELFHLEVNGKLFIVLYIAHKIGDYLFQTDKQARLKSEEWGPLLKHCLVYTLIVIGVAYLYTGLFNWTAVMIIFFTHVFLDKRSFLLWWGKYVKRVKESDIPHMQSAMLELDQAFHYIVLFIVSLIY
ncbi:DUF3307 domain-containing protein [Saccharococcus caldoxylosilyticus]|uniref:Pycsar effector protein domain-containing protein n=1 Tax=Parageobacillus caldoxylosilyticus NBRC 107762 TaxID=1220594 RepID=A0A023DK62_9BACL|nr:DUF3307 domain-containing protein [Parageobacillus caldoxylosilyticus]MBB3854519.1 hypothetical protein [Parageobacillus caldoxylosilyticus]GAJ41659.1 hypothetical protein GCA01S_084_00020 [Parageobacillus caldoxylosilyticus NBRC 107762]